MSDLLELEPRDYSVVVKRRDLGDAPWRWEIWVAGNSRPVERSERPFTSMAQASREGKAALKALLAREFPTAA